MGTAESKNLKNHVNFYIGDLFFRSPALWSSQNVFGPPTAGRVVVDFKDRGVVGWQQGNDIIESPSNLSLNSWLLLLLHFSSTVTKHLITHPENFLPLGLSQLVTHSQGKSVSTASRSYIVFAE